MDLFNVIISPKALSQLNSYVDYLQYTLLNVQAARNVWQDAIETRDRLSKVAESLKLYTTLSSDEFNFAHKKAGTLSNLCSFNYYSVI